MDGMLFLFQMISWVSPIAAKIKTADARASVNPINFCSEKGKES
jgi:hypothetical protein